MLGLVFVFCLCAGMNLYGKKPVYFATGFKIGEVTQNAAVIWTRLTTEPERNWEGVVFQPKDSRTRVMVDIPDIPVHEWEGSAAGTEGQVRVLYSPKADLTNAKATPWIAVNSNADYTHQFVLGGLQQNTRYHLVVEGRPGSSGSVTQSARGSFLTPADPGHLQDILFTVSSCQMYSHLDHHLGFKIYASMLRAFAKIPDFMVRAGDSVYYDRDNPRGKTPDLCRLHWQRHYSLPYLRTFHANVPCYWLKDDHDSFFDDCWRTYDAPWIAPLTYEEAEKCSKSRPLLLWTSVTVPYAGGKIYKSGFWKEGIFVRPTICPTDPKRRSGVKNRKRG